MNITQEQYIRATEAAKHSEVRWHCGNCAAVKFTDNKIKRKQCFCGNWMMWSTPMGV